MKALRLKIKQQYANYQQDNKALNKNTLPLPSFSVIIGAIHSACRYKEYKEMKVSVQGKYSSIREKKYRKHTMLNSVFDDRGTLVWFENPNVISSAYIKVAEALAMTGCSFLNRENVRVLDENLYKEYVELKKSKSELKNFKTLITSIDATDLLCDVELIIHISVSEKVMNDILENVYNIVSLGSSESFIDLEEIQEVELVNVFDREHRLNSGFGMYLNINCINTDCYLKEEDQIGTVFEVSKTYKIVKDKRVFEKVSCLYATDVCVDEKCSGGEVYTDGEFLVNLN